MRILTRAEVTAAHDLDTLDVPVPEWGEDVGVRMRTLTSGEKDRLEKAMFDVAVEADDKGALIERRTLNAKFNLKTALLGMSLIDESGGRLYQDDEIDTLGSKDFRVVNRLFARCLKLNKMQGEAVKDAEKNSDGDRSGSSASGSPAN